MNRTLPVLLTLAAVALFVGGGCGNEGAKDGGGRAGNASGNKEDRSKERSADETKQSAVNNEESGVNKEEHPAAKPGATKPSGVRIRGRITYGGGEWPAPGCLYFSCVKSAEEFPWRPAHAEFDTDGTFEAREGLMPGRYKVTVECWERPPTPEDDPGKNYVPPEYRSPATTPFELTANPDDNAIEDLQWDVPKRGPVAGSR